MLTSTCIPFFEMHPQRVEEEIQDVCYSILLKKGFMQQKKPPELANKVS
jgi:hypothetical protein